MELEQSGPSAVGGGTNSKRISRVLYTLVPTRGTVSADTAAWLTLLPQFAGEVGFQRCPVIFMAYYDAPEARERLAKMARSLMDQNSFADEHWCMWVDDDMVPSVRSLATLYLKFGLNKNIGVLAAHVCLKRDNDPGLLPSLGTREWMLPGRDFRPGALVEVDWCSLAFTMHRAEILRTLPEPWFHSTSDRFAGEDSWFTHQLRRAGLRTYVDTGCLVGHIEQPSGKPGKEEHAFARPHIFYPLSAVEAIEDATKATGLVPEAPAEPVVAQIKPAEGQPLCAFLNCNNPNLAEHMLKTLRGGRIVILDNGGFLTHQFDEAHPDDNYAVVPTEKNLGWGGGFNYLMQKVMEQLPDTQAVWVCNDDINDATFEKAMRLYDTLMSDESYAVVSPVNKMCSWACMQPKGDNQLRMQGYIDFCAPMVKVSAWKDVGPLDVETFGPGHGLDLDWSWRARKRGWKLIVDDALSIDHPTPGTTCFSAGTTEEHVNATWAEKLANKHHVTYHDIVMGVTTNDEDAA